MSGVLVWSGAGPIEESAAAPNGAAALPISHTLLERHGSGWRPVASRIAGSPPGDAAENAHVVLRPAAAASRLAVHESELWNVPAHLDPLRQLVFPAIQQLFAALSTAADPGWTAWVSGSGLLAALCLAAAPSLGARRTVWIPEDGGEAAALDADEIVAGGRDARAERLAALAAQSYGRVIGFETTGDVVALQALLAALPAGAALVLPGLAAPRSAAVNFYRDVHKKNVAIVGAGAEVRGDRGLAARAERWLRLRLQPSWSPRLAECEARIDIDPAPDSGQLLLLAWPGAAQVSRHDAER